MSYILKIFNLIKNKKYVRDFLSIINKKVINDSKMFPHMVSESVEISEVYSDKNTHAQLILLRRSYWGSLQRQIPPPWCHHSYKTSCMHLSSRAFPDLQAILFYYILFGISMCSLSIQVCMQAMNLKFSYINVFAAKSLIFCSKIAYLFSLKNFIHIPNLHQNKFFGL